MQQNLLLAGMALGFSIAAPVGPIGVLCIRRSLSDGHWKGLVAGLGAATADAAYGCVAGFGLKAVSGFLGRQQFWLGLVGGIFLCFLGLRVFMSRPAGDEAPAPARGYGAIYGSTFLLTLANPSTILSFAGAFAGIGLGRSAGYHGALEVVLGVFLGSATWWIILSSTVGMLRSRVDAAWMKAVNRVSGTVLFAFGVFALGRL